MGSMPVPKAECSRLIEDLFKDFPEGSGFRPNIARVLGNCLYNKNISLEQYNKAIEWMENRPVHINPGDPRVETRDLSISINPLDVDVIGAYSRALTRLYEWIASFGHQVGPTGDFVGTITATSVIALASCVHDVEFKTTVLKAGASYLSRAAEAAEKSKNEARAA